MILVALMAWPALAAAQHASPEFDVSDFSATYRPRADVSPDGRFVVTWLDPPQASGWTVRARRFDAAAQALGPAFVVSAGTSYARHRPVVSMMGDGTFAVAWAQAGHPWSIRGQRYDANGAPIGGQWVASQGAVNGSMSDLAMASDALGHVAVWTRTWEWQTGGVPGVYARRVDAAGVPQGAEFRVNTSTTGLPVMPAVAFSNVNGNMMVTWAATGQDGSDQGVRAQRYVGGLPAGGEQAVNTYTTGMQSFPAVASAADTGFVIGWVSSDGPDDAGAGVFARQYDGAGAPLGPEFRVSSSPVRLAQHAVTIVSNVTGGYAIGWSSGASESYVRRYDRDGNPLGPEVAVSLASPGQRRDDVILAGNWVGRLLLTSRRPTLDARGQLLGPIWPGALAVDETGPGDHNGVLDPGEAATVAPTWMFHGFSPPSSVTGTASLFSGPGAPSNPAYTIVDGSADYGSMASGIPSPCLGDCYVLGVSPASPRPQRHVDATFREDLDSTDTGAESRTWRVHIGGSFDDVPRTSGFYRFAETLMHNGVSTGCAAATYCPSAATTREQMAVFLLMSKMGAGYRPPRPAQGLFPDVPANSPFAPWIEDLTQREVVAGCGSGSFCPQAPVTRAQMAVMVLRAVEGPAYAPAACATPPFDDVPCSDPFAAWIAEIARRGLTAGCGGGAYCPGAAVTREQMAVFLTRGFSLPLYGP
jgi:hypothetical protein